VIAALQIEKWFGAESRRAQELLPELIRQLITETVHREDITKLRIPVRDEIGLPDFDGVVVAREEYLNVPARRSVWEWTTAGENATKLAAKFKENYDKRADDPLRAESIFVFVTPHKWDSMPTLQSKLEQYRTKKEWLDVRVIDRTRLESWLAVCPFTASWLLHEFTGHAGPIRSCDTYFEEELGGKYGGRLQPSAIIAGREGNVEEMITWAGSGSTGLRVIGESVEEASAFIASVGIASSSTGSSSLADAVFFVESVEALHHLTLVERPYILVMSTEDARKKAAQLREKGLRTIIPLARQGRRPVAKAGDVVLESMHREELEKVLAEMGFSTTRAREIARESKGSFAGLLWQIAEEHEALAWTHGEAVSELVPILLVGQWEAQNEHDQKVVELLSGRPYGEVRSLVLKWHYPSGPLIRRGPLVDWLAWPSAVKRLAQHLDEAAIERFSQAVRGVLAEVDPALELPPDERWLANLKGKTIPHSQALRSGLASALTLLAISGNEVSGTHGQVVADSLVGELLPRDEEAPARWYSLAPYLPELAEAAPVVFLKRAQLLSGQPSVVAALFEEEGYFGSARHVHLLWALERIAWSQKHLMDAVLVLADLASLDPGGSTSNRPVNSLVEILLPWNPQTSAGVHERLGVLDAVKSRQEDIAWDLALRLFHGVTRISSPTAKPRFRDWADDAERATTSDYREFMLELTKRLPAWAEERPHRWADLIPNMGRCQSFPELYLPFLDGLTRLDPAQLDAPDRQQIADALRSFVNRHRSFSDSDWALDNEQLMPFDELLNRLEPEDPIARHSWLFGGWPEIPELKGKKIKDVFSELRRRRAEALREVYAELGINGVMALAEKCENASDVGTALATLDVTSEDEEAFMQAGLSLREAEKGVPPLLQSAWAFVFESYHLRGSSWLDNVVANASGAEDPSYLANLALGLPANGTTWNAVEAWGTSVAEQYWRRTSVSVLQDPKRDGERAVTELLRVKRPYRAMQVVSLVESGEPGKEDTCGPQVFSCETLKEVLSQLPNHLPSDELYGPDRNMVPHYVDTLFWLLDGAGVDLDTLMSLEFPLLPFLENAERGPRAIRESIKNNARVFIDLICLAYRGEDEETPDDIDDSRRRTIASFAHKILDSFTQVPGASYTGEIRKGFEGDIPFAEGSVDGGLLTAWVSAARDQADKEKRVDVCDSLIGQLLAHSPSTGGKWPSEAVCKLLEEVGSAAIEQGLDIGLFNKRGVHWRGQGGDQERSLADKFRQFANELNSKWTRARAVLWSMVRQLEQMATAEDRRSEFEEFE
jgi:hypothetical protein